MKSKFFAFSVIVTKKTIVNSKVILSSNNNTVSFNILKNYKNDSNISNDPIPINTNILFYIIAGIVFVSLIIYVSAIFYKYFIRYHFAIFIGFLFQLLNAWLLSKIENKVDIKNIINNTFKYFLLRSNKLINMILNLILMNLNLFLHESFSKLIFFYIIKLIVFYLLEIGYFDGTNNKGSFMYMPISINSAFTLLIIIFYIIHFKKIIKLYKNFVRAGLSTNALDTKFKIVYAIFFTANIFELISCIIFNYFFYSYNLGLFIVYHYLDFIMIVIYFIIYFPVRYDIGNIVDYMKLELIRREILDILMFDEMIAQGQFKKINIYELDTESIKEEEFFGNNNNVEYIIIQNPYLTEENSDMNKLMSNNINYEDIKIGYIEKVN